VNVGRLLAERGLVAVRADGDDHLDVLAREPVENGAKRGVSEPRSTVE
jgi:hypothetical protein